MSVCVGSLYKHAILVAISVKRRERGWKNTGMREKHENLQKIVKRDCEKRRKEKYWFRKGRSYRKMKRKKERVEFFHEEVSTSLLSSTP